VIRAAVLICCLAAAAPAVADDEAPHIIFSIKDFSDAGDTVHVEGTLTGDGVGYKDNRWSITCFQSSRGCLSVRIETLGVQVFPIGIPGSFTVRVWTPDRIVADDSAPCGAKPDRVKEDWQTVTSDTWIIDRNRQTAELIEHPCLGSKTYHWTIEDPPFWKKAKEGRAGQKAP